MSDYVEFMMNWMRRKKKEHYFADKIEIYHFLTNEDEYKKYYPTYKNRLEEYA